MVTRGPKYITDIWAANMQSQMSKWQRLNLKTGKQEDFRVQWNLKPIQLWEVVAPEEAIPEIMHYNGIPGTEKQCHAKELEPLAFGFRKMLGLQKMPKYDIKKLKIEPNRLIYREALSIYGLGVKPDTTKDFPQWGYRQEGL